MAKAITKIKSSKSLNDLPLDAICKNISLYEDRSLRFQEVINTYDFLDVSNYKDNPDMVLAILTKASFNMLFQTPNMTFNTMAEYVEKVFFSIFDVEEDNLKRITKNILRMSHVYSYVSSILEGAQHVLANTIVYKAIGVKPRNSYSFVLDLIFVNANNELNYLVISPYQNINGAEPLRSTKFILGLDYLLELNLKVTNGHIVYLSNKNPENYYASSVRITDYVKSYVLKYQDITLLDKPNMHYCGMCPYKNSCRNSNLYEA